MTDVVDKIELLVADRSQDCRSHASLPYVVGGSVAVSVGVSVGAPPPQAALSEHVLVAVATSH